MDNDKNQTTSSDDESPNGYWTQLTTAQLSSLTTEEIPSLFSSRFPKIEELDLNNIVGNLNSGSFTYTTIPSLTIPNNGYQINNVQYGFQSTYQTNPSMQVNGKVNVEGENADIVINGRSLKEFMSKLESRLAILQPNPEKLEQFEALRKAYEHYKLLESLCEIDDTDDKK